MVDSAIDDSAVPFAALAAALCCLAGCATPLQVQTTAGPIAKAAGLPSSEVAFVSYCSFRYAPASGRHVSFEEGFIAVTRDSLVFLTGDDSNPKVSERIAFSAIRGVDLRRFGRGRQLQVLTRAGVRVVEIARNKALIDASASQEVYDTLRQRGIPEWKSERFYLRRPKTLVVPVPI